MTRVQERAELHRTIWQVAHDLRGNVDGWDFKQYVLGMLFYRFISENLSAYINESEQKRNKSFTYENLSDEQAEHGREEIIKDKGFFITPSKLFVNVKANAHDDSSLNETLSDVFTAIEGSAIGKTSEKALKGLFDDFDVNSSKLGASVEKRNEKLAKLLDAIGNLKLGIVSEQRIDAFGDAYEYLMTMYASSAGRSGGEFFTPQEVSELLAQITCLGKKQLNKVYDPACGSGSLLLKFHKIIDKKNIRGGFYGQEINLTTYNLCRINMLLHNINYTNFTITHGDTLIDPAHDDDAFFDAIVSNPPYSTKWAGDSNPLLINDERFAPAGILAPKSKADFAFTMHVLHHLSTSGTAAIVQFPGVLYRGGAEQKIREYLVKNNYIDTIIALPSELFFGTSIATCIVVLKKSKKDNSILFIDASREYIRSGNKNILSEDNRNAILKAFETRSNVTHFCALIDNKDIANNDYNLSVSRYVESEEKDETVDIRTLNTEITRIVQKQEKLRSAIDAIVCDIEGVEG